MSIILFQIYEKSKAKFRQIYYPEQATKASLIIRDDCLELYYNINMVNEVKTDNVNFTFAIKC